MQEEETIVPVKVFDVERFQKFLASLPEESHPIIRPSLSASEDNIRDAAQREAFWRGQLKVLRRGTDSEARSHAEEELAHALFTQGKIDDALELAKKPERRAYYESIGMAILKDDNDFCDCPESEEVIIDGKSGTSQFWHQVGMYPSAKHGGKLTPIYKCAK